MIKYLFFLLLAFFSFSALADFPASCPGETVYSRCTGSTANIPSSWAANCATKTNSFYTSRAPKAGECNGPDSYYSVVCLSNCSCPDSPDITLSGNVCIVQCPEGTKQNTYIDGSGNSLQNCVPDTGEPDSCPSGYPKFNGQCALCVNGYNANGSCADESPTSSAASSPPTSAPPTSAPPTSAPPTSSPDSGSSGGDNGSGGDGSGSGGGGGGSGDGSGGSGSGTGTSAGSAASAGAATSWTPVAGYGNWIPVPENSPCPNKFQDSNGQWWCSGGNAPASSGAATSSPSNGSSGSAGSAGSAASAASTSAESSSVSSDGVSGGGSCDDAPVCDATEVECNQLLQLWAARCGPKLDDGFFDLDEGAGDVTFSNSLTEFQSGIEASPNVQAIDNFFSFGGSGSCPVWQVSAWVFEIVIDQQCSPNIPWALISGILIAVASLMAARISFT